MANQLRAIDFASNPASADPVTLRAVQKAVALIELKFTLRKRRTEPCVSRGSVDLIVDDGNQQPVGLVHAQPRAAGAANFIQNSL